MEVPRFVTHYHLADRRPFLNLSDLDDTHLARVLGDLDRLHQLGLQHRPFGPRYMGLRRATETLPRTSFIEAGGTPDRSVPHYFVLGESPWYEHLAPDMAHVRLAVSALPSNKTSVTYPDSFTAMGVGSSDGVATHPSRWSGRAHLLEAVPHLIADVGLPMPAWNDDHRDAWTSWPAAAYIELQLWTDDPVRDHLDQPPVSRHNRTHRRPTA